MVAESSSTWSCCGAAAAPLASRSGPSPPVHLSPSLQPRSSASFPPVPSSLRRYVPVYAEVSLHAPLLSMSRLSSRCSELLLSLSFPQLIHFPVPSLLTCHRQLPLSLCKHLSYPLLSGCCRFLFWSGFPSSLGMFHS